MVLWAIVRIKKCLWDFQNKLVVIDDENVEITIEADQSTDNPRHIMSYGKLKIVKS